MPRAKKDAPSTADLLAEAERQQRARSFSSSVTEGDYLTSIRTILALIDVCDTKEPSPQLDDVRAALEQVRDAGAEVHTATAKLIETWKHALRKSLDAQASTT